MRNSNGTTRSRGLLCRLKGRITADPPIPGNRMDDVSSVTGGPRGFGIVRRTMLSGFCSPRCDPADSELAIRRVDYCTLVSACRCRLCTAFSFDKYYYQNVEVFVQLWTRR